MKAGERRWEVEIQNAMTARGLNPYTLARAAGVSQPGLSKWLNGKQATITLATVEKVAAAMGMDVRLVRRRKDKP